MDISPNLKESTILAFNIQYLKSNIQWNPDTSNPQWRVVLRRDLAAGGGRGSEVRRHTSDNQKHTKQIQSSEVLGSFLRRLQAGYGGLKGSWLPLKQTLKTITEQKFLCFLWFLWLKKAEQKFLCLFVLFRGSIDYDYDNDYDYEFFWIQSISG